jgi:hypothetical protein
MPSASLRFLGLPLIGVEGGGGDVDGDHYAIWNVFKPHLVGTQKKETPGFPGVSLPMGSPLPQSFNQRAGVWEVLFEGA